MKAWISAGLLMFTCWAVVAEEKKKIYKYTDENGVTHYTETKPNENYEEADLPELSIIPSAPVNETTTSTSIDDEEYVDPSEVTDFKILKPTQEQNLWGTGGKVTVAVPEMNEEQSVRYKVQFVLDGKKMKASSDTTQTFSEIYRGEHTVQALLVDRISGKVDQRSKVVTFFMHQNSIK